MSLAKLDIFFKSIVNLVDIAILVFHCLGFLPAIFNLASPNSKSVFSLAEDFCHFIVLHDFRLIRLVVVNGLAFVFIAESVDFSDLSLNIFDQGQG